MHWAGPEKATLAPKWHAAASKAEAIFFTTFLLFLVPSSKYSTFGRFMKMHKYEKLYSKMFFKLFAIPILHEENYSI